MQATTSSTSDSASKLNYEVAASTEHAPTERLSWFLNQKRHILSIFYFFISIARYLVYISVLAAIIWFLLSCFRASDPALLR